MIFQHDEWVSSDTGHKPLWWPRRPFVAIPDTLMAVVLGWLCTQTSSAVQLYFLVACLMFLISAIHHWLAIASWHHIADRLMIFWLISLTPVPFVSMLADQPVFFLLWIGSMACSLIGSLWLVVYYQKHNKMPSVDVYKPSFLLGSGALLGVTLPSASLYVCLWLGVCLYVLNGVVAKYSFPSSAYFRPLQHIGCLIPAGVLHSYVMLSL